MNTKLKISTFYEHQVYQPSEDTYFLLNTLDCIKEQLIALNPSIILDLGAGTGIIGMYINKLLRPYPSFIISLDINTNATLAASNTLQLNNIPHDTICSDLIAPLNISIIDLIIFNTPYVKCDNCSTCKKTCYTNNTSTNHSSDSSSDISRSWCGGNTGNNPLYSLLNTIKSKYKKTKTEKTLIVLLEQFQSFKKFIESPKYKYFFKFEVLNKKRIFNENLFIIKITF